MRNFILALIIIILIALYFFFINRKENKEELAKYYKITKPTLNKWVQYFPGSISSKHWKSKRKLTGLESAELKNHWGSNTDFVLRKEQIAEKGSASYKTLSKCVMENLEKIGLSEEAWKKCSVFPPIICQRIIDLLIGKSVPTVEKRFATLFTNPIIAA